MYQTSDLLCTPRLELWQIRLQVPTQQGISSNRKMLAARHAGARNFISLHMKSSDDLQPLSVWVNSKSTHPCSALPHNGKRAALPHAGIQQHEGMQACRHQAFREQGCRLVHHCKHVCMSLQSTENNSVHTCTFTIVSLKCPGN